MDENRFLRRAASTQAQTNAAPSGAPRRRRTGRALLLLLVALNLSLALSRSTVDAAAPGVEQTPDKLPSPILDGLGTLEFPVTTSSPRAQRYFNQGMRLLFGFNHREAIRSFRSAAFLDPGCAMAHWGAAYALGPHVNRPMDASDTAQAWAELQMAVAAAPRVSPREQAWIRALETRYRPEHRDDRLELDRAFAAALRLLAREYPDDLHLQVLFAESLMNTMPWDYWTRDRSPKPETQEILAALRFVLSRDPDHPGANHFYIHAVEAGPNPELGLPSADRLRDHAPAAGHLVHMPSHIYMRVGQYADAMLANEKAVRADRDYLRRSRALGFYPAAYYPHNLHFLWWAQLFQGRSRDALRTAQQTAAYVTDSLCGPTPAVEAPRLRHLPWLTLARFGRWTDVLALPQPAGTNDYLVDRALWHFVRSLAHAALRQPGEAAHEAQALEQLATGAAVRQLDNPAFPASGTIAVAAKWAAAQAAGARGDTQARLNLLREAVAAEDALPYMEPTFWPIPVRPALGAALLQAGRFADAETVFREDLQRWPRNGWGLFGLEQCLRSQGKTAQADDVRRQFNAAWQEADEPLRLEWF